MQLAVAQLYLEELKESQEKTIIYCHDMRHNLNLIDAYLAGNNKAVAQKCEGVYFFTTEDEVFKTCIIL